MSLEQEIRNLTEAIKTLTLTLQQQQGLTPNAVNTEAVITESGALKPASRTLDELRQLCVKISAVDFIFSLKLSQFLKENYSVATIKQLDDAGIAEVYHFIMEGHVCELPGGLFDTAAEPTGVVEAVKEAQAPSKPVETSATAVYTVDDVSQRCLELIRAKIVDKAGLLALLSKYNGATTITKVPKDSLAELAHELENLRNGDNTHV